MTDNVNHPKHYTSHPSGTECITIVEHMNFNVGNAVKYLWRAGLKSDDAMTDLRKAAWYINREIVRLQLDSNIATAMPARARSEGAPFTSPANGPPSGAPSTSSSEGDGT